MKINREVLLKHLTNLKPGLANKEIVEQTTHFIFKDEKIFTYNDEISIACSFDIGFEGAIKANEFHKVIDKFTKDEIGLVLKDNELKLSCGRARAGLSIDSDIKIDAIDAPEKWFVLPEGFLKAMKFCSFSAARNITKIELTCINVEKDTVVSCDNYRMTRKHLPKRVRKPFMIPVHVAEQLGRYEPISYNTDENWLHFKCEGDIVFSCRKIGLDYPDLAQFFEVEGAEIKMPDNLNESIEKAGVLASAEFDQERFITISIESNKLICKGTGSFGWLEESIKISYDKEPIKLKVHPDHFIEILSHLDTVVIGENSLLFKGGDFEHIISLAE